MQQSQGPRAPRPLKEIVNPEHTVVLVQDSQNIFLHKDGRYQQPGGGGQDASHIFQPMTNFLSAARTRKIRVMYSVFTMLPSLSALTDPGTVDQNSLIEGTWGWQIFDQVKPQGGEVVVKKHRNDTFIGTDLEMILRANGIKTIIHIGISVPNGILASTWHASNLGFNSVVPRDAAGAVVAELEPEGWKLTGRMATITTTEEIVKTWDS